MCEGNHCANCEYLYNGEYCLYRQEYIEDKDISGEDFQSIKVMLVSREDEEKSEE